MDFNEALGEAIREQRLARKMTLREVASAGFISMGHLSDVEQGRKQGSSGFINAVANGLGVEAYELIIEAGFKMSAGTIPETAEKIYERSREWTDQYSDLAG